MGGKSYRWMILALILAWAPRTVAQTGMRFQPTPEKKSPPNLADLDDVKEIHGLRTAPGLVRQGSWSQLKEGKIASGPGIRKSLGEAMAKALAEHDKFGKELESSRNNALFGTPKIGSEIFEFPDSFVIVRSTSAVVRDPETLAKQSSLFRNYLMGKGPTPRITLADLKPEGIQGLREFMKSDVEKLAADDPLRQAAGKGETSLLQAIADGVGPVELVDTFHVPKTAFPVVDGKLQLPFPSKVLSNFRVARPDDRGEEANARQRETEPVEKPDLITSGKSEIHAKFLAGFTLGNDWTWNRRWNYPSGFFRITLGAKYGVGLRIPIQVEGEFYPTRAVLKDTRNRSLETTFAMRARAVDGDESFYRDTGIPENLLFGAKEAVLEAQFGFGYKFRALWTDISSRPFSYFGLDFSENFTPPTGRDGDAPVISIPPHLTHTAFDFGGLDGSATFGIRLVGTGTIQFDYETMAAGKTIQTKKIESRSTDRQTINGLIPAEATDYGFRLKNPAYRYDLELVPTVKLNGRVHCPGFSRGISTGWIDLNSLAIDVGTVSLERHAGTRKSISFNGGKKSFKKIQDTNYTPRMGDSVYITLNNGKYFHFDETKGTMLANGDRPDKSGLFEFHQFNNKSFTLWLKEVSGTQGGLPIGAQKKPDDRIALARHAPEKWEYFELVRAESRTGDDHFFLIKCKENGKYLGMRQGTVVLAAEVTDIQKAARFKFWPAQEENNSR